MHSFLKSIGFSKLVKRKEINQILYDVVENYDERITVTEHPDGIFTEYTRFYCENCGVSVCGKYEDQKFHVEYFYPFFRSTHHSSSEKVTIERKADKDAFSGACDDLRVGITLIFYLQKPGLYMQNIAKGTQDKNKHDLILTALASEGKILLPIEKDEQDIMVAAEISKNHENLLAAAREGDEEAMESLTMEEMDTYSMISERIVDEDILSIVDNYFMPHGIECDQYSILGDILECHRVNNNVTAERVWQLRLRCSDVEMCVCINELQLMGEPAPGRRFKGYIWLQGDLY